MSEKLRQLMLADGERGALIMVVLEWIETVNQEDPHCAYDEVLNVYQNLLKL